MGTFSFLASWMPMSSRLGSTTKTPRGSPLILRMPPRIFSSLALSFCNPRISFFGTSLMVSSANIRSNSFKRSMLRLIVVKFVNMPPSHRWFTYGMPQRSASSRIDS